MVVCAVMTFHSYKVTYITSVVLYVVTVWLRRCYFWKIREQEGFKLGVGWGEAVASNK